MAVVETVEDILELLEMLDLVDMEFLEPMVLVVGAVEPITLTLVV